MRFRFRKQSINEMIATYISDSDIEPIVALCLAIKKGLFSLPEGTIVAFRDYTKATDFMIGEIDSIETCGRTFGAHELSETCFGQIFGDLYIMIDVFEAEDENGQHYCFLEDTSAWHRLKFHAMTGVCVSLLEDIGYDSSMTLAEIRHDDEQRSVGVSDLETLNVFNAGGDKQ